MAKTNLTNVNHRDSCGNEIPSEKREHNGVHVGVYAPGTPGYRRIFYDEVRVAVGSDGYDLVAPGQADADSRGPLPEMEPVPSPPVIADQ